MKRNKKRGTVLLYSVALLALMVVIATSYVDRTTLSYRKAKQNTYDLQLTMLCEAGIQTEMQSLWVPFKQAQSFKDLDTALTGSSASSPHSATLGQMNGIGKYSVGVTTYMAPNGDTYSRYVRIRCVTWVDNNNNGVLDSDEPSKTIDSTYKLSLNRSAVFDYTYFVNNFGWMTGFGANDLIVNGDMRSNGDFNFTNGSGTVNGSLVASYNSKLSSVAAGVVNLSPYKWDDATYEQKRRSDPFYKRIRPSYTSSSVGALGTSQFETYRDVVYQDQAQVVNSRPFGAVVQDSSGTKSWSFNGSNMTSQVIDTTPSQELVMPDLTSFGSVNDTASATGGRFAKTKAWTDTKQTFQDGTANPNYAMNSSAQNEFNADGSPNVNYTGAYLDIWDSTKNAYKRVSSQGVVSSSVLLAGTSSHPIRVHGPVSINGDIGIAGTISGQGTLYCARNAHVLGSIVYANPPDFSGSDMSVTDQQNEHKDMLGIAASQSVIMGDTTSFGASPLNYMTPPFTKARTDDNGNVIPAYDATQVDSWGIKKYQSLLETNAATAAAYKAMAAGGVNQIDAIMYTNFCGGGNIGTNGQGFTINGSIISRDEAMVTWSLPMRMNYDTRIRERSLSSKPLIDIDVPRSPSILRMSYQVRGFDSK